MIGYLNERSIDAYGDWVAALRLFLGAAQQLLSAGSLLFKDSRFFAQPDFIRRFNALALPRDQSALMRELVFGSRYYKCWTVARLSVETERYACADPNLNLADESLCEAAERRIVEVGDPVSIVSAPGSAFEGKRLVNISKLSSAQAVELRNATSIQAIIEWITSESGFYNPDSRHAPRDFQTVLAKDGCRFRKTGKIERRFSRQVFEEMDTGYLYYVDEGHPGRSAHLEVFSAHGDHLGTADINRAELDTTARVHGRVLKL